MRMLRWMCDNTLKERVRDECIREKFEVAQIEDKTREKNRLRRFGRAQCN